MFTFLERYLSRMSGKSMPVDLDAVKPFMGFCTAIKYVFCERQNERMLYFPDGRILDRCYLGTKMPREIQEDSRIVVTQWARVTVAVGWFSHATFIP